MTIAQRPGGSQQRPSPAIDPDINTVAIPRPANELDGKSIFKKSEIKIKRRK